MVRELRYGEGGVVRFDPPADVVLADFPAPPGQPIADPARVVATALSDPLDYPPLDRAAVLGDRIVLAVDDGVPRLPEVIAGVVRVLVDGPILPEDITVVLACNEHGPADLAPAQLLDPDVASAIRIVHHDPRDRESLAYLAASRDNKPIYINRLVFDADVVLPIGCLRPDNTLGYLGIHGGLFPVFSDDKTQQRFRSSGSSVHQRRHLEEADEAAWLLGVQIILQVVPGAGESILHVVAGTPDAVAKRGHDLCEAAWSYRVPRRAGLVVASIEGGQAQQTWDNFGRALYAALAAVEDDGAIVLCTDLRRHPGPALQRLATLEDGPSLLRAIQHDRPPDAVSASLLVEARDRTRVYLMSGLKETTVEELGVGYVSREEEISRLSQQYDSCILLANAHRAAVLATSE